MKWVCLLMFGSVGLTMFSLGLGWGTKRYLLMKNGVRTTGTVVEIDESASTTSQSGRTISSRSYYPHVEFTAEDGKTYKFRGSTGSGLPEYEKGAKVELFYQRDNPWVAQVYDFEQFWLGPLAIGLFGFLFLVAGIGGFFLIQSSDREMAGFDQKLMEDRAKMEGKF